MRRRVVTSVSKDQIGQLLLTFLANRYRFKGVDAWAQTLSKREVWLNGQRTDQNVVLKFGDEILYEAPDAPEPEVDRNVSVIYVDEHLIAVNKSGNLPCHPSGCYCDNTLLNLLKSRYVDADLHLINRLDRESSGVVIVALNASVARLLSAQFMERRVVKRYSVIVEGSFPERLDACGWLLKDETSVVRKKRCFIAGCPEHSPALRAEWAETRFQLIERCGELSLVNADLITGRMHQIRATLASLGYPVAGDKIYGVDESIFIRFINDQLTATDKRLLRISRQALHAREVVLRHPVGSEILKLTAPLPDDMQSLLCGVH